MAALEALVLAWWAEKLYKIWSRLYCFVVAIRLPWQTRAEVGADDGIEAKAEVEAQPKRGRYRQAAIDARNDIDLKLFAAVTG